MEHMRRLFKKPFSMILEFTLIGLFAIPLVGTQAWAKNIVQGIIVFSNGKPAAGVKVVAMDSDPGGNVNKDDTMGEAITDAQGYYKVTYKKKDWDSNVPLTHKARPDIYIKILTNLEGKWVQVDKSSVHSDWDMNKDLIINKTVTLAHAESDTGFDVRKHGFSFVNGNWGKVCVSVAGVTKLRYDDNGKFCGGSAGLCGGMSFRAGERFRAGRTSIELAKEAMKPDLVNAQFQTLDEKSVGKMLEWIASPDEGHTLDPHHSVGYRMKEDWNNSIKPRLDRREPVVLGLVFNKHATLLNLREVGALSDVMSQHMVLATGYTMSGPAVKIRAYDPNRPGEVFELGIILGETGVSQKLLSGKPTGHPKIRGVMFVRGVPAAVASPPTPAQTPSVQTSPDDDYTVTIYENINYGGAHKTYTVELGKCLKLDPDLHSSNWGDKISSVKVGSKVGVHLFQHVRYSQGKVDILQDVPKLGSLKLGNEKDGWNDQASSLIVFLKEGGGWGAHLKGSKWQYLPVNEGCEGMTEYPHLYYNDDATEFYVWPNSTVTVYQDANFGGASQEFSGVGGPFKITNGKIKGKVSSVRIQMNETEPKRK